MGHVFLRISIGSMIAGIMLKAAFNYTHCVIVRRCRNIANSSMKGFIKYPLFIVRICRNISRSSIRLYSLSLYEYVVILRKAALDLLTVSLYKKCRNIAKSSMKLTQFVIAWIRWNANEYYLMSLSNVSISVTTSSTLRGFNTIINTTLKHIDKLPQFAKFCIHRVFWEYTIDTFI